MLSGSEGSAIGICRGGPGSRITGATPGKGGAGAGAAGGGGGVAGGERTAGAAVRLAPSIMNMRLSRCCRSIDSFSFSSCSTRSWSC